MASFCQFSKCEKFEIYIFVGNFIWVYAETFMKMTSLLRRHLYLEHSQSVQSSGRQFSVTTHQVLYSTITCQKK